MSPFILVACVVFVIHVFCIVLELESKHMYIFSLILISGEGLESRDPKPAQQAEALGWLLFCVLGSCCWHLIGGEIVGSNQDI